QSYFRNFPDTQCGRGLQVLELHPPWNEQRHPGPINIGNIHYELDLDLRSLQIKLSISWLSRNFSLFPIGSTSSGFISESYRASVASILCGDTNVFEVVETQPFTDHGYTDCWMKMNPDIAASSTVPSSRPSGSTFGLFGLKSTLDSNGVFPHDAHVRRLDFVLARNFDVKECVYLGTKEEGTGSGKTRMKSWKIH
ncbi:uncharacterized protein EI90DRAFT_3043594, partial [Cantharellus anzutake]|uniref:uncharacterized protein n=1 Tax=Cantharellus anzutake TaxID=1750568 RepID=UPI0019050377